MKRSYWEKDFKRYNHTGRRFQGIQLYWEKVSRNTIIQGEGFNGYSYTGRRIKGIQSYRKTVSMDTIK